MRKADIKSLLALVLTTSVCFTNAACSKKGTSAPVATTGPSAVDLDKQNRDNQAKTQGGQPGTVFVSGIPVKDLQTLDSRVTVTATGGVGQGQTAVAVGAVHLPVYSKKVDSIQMTDPTLLKTLLASSGCDATTVANFAKQNSLNVGTMPTSNTLTLVVQAKMIVLCGSMTAPQNAYVTYSADQIVFENLDYSQTSNGGFTEFFANSLTLTGANKLESKGIDSNMTTSAGPQVILKVAKELDSDTTGNLAVTATGANYKASR